MSAAEEASEQSVERIARLDLLTGIVGAAICTTFVLSLGFAGGPGGTTAQVPLDQIAGMIFTCMLCPLVYLLSKRYYLRHRVLFVLAVRLAFAYGTVHDYGDTPNEDLTYVFNCSKTCLCQEKTAFFRGGALFYQFFFLSLVKHGATFSFVVLLL